METQPDDEELVTPFPGYPVCAICSTALELHQPDSDRPDRILGACVECGAWHLVDEDDETLYLLPDLAWFHKNREAFSQLRGSSEVLNQGLGKLVAQWVGESWRYRLEGR